MKISFVILGKRDYKNIIESFDNNYSPSDYEIVFLTNEQINLKKYEDMEGIPFRFLIFDQYASENEMMEYYFQNEKPERVILLKNSYTNFKISDMNKFVTEINKKSRDLIVSKQNKPSTFFTKLKNYLTKWLVKLFFGFKMYDAEADIVYLSPLTLSILKQSRGRSAMFLKMNVWSGIETDYLTIPEQKKTKLSGVSSMGTRAFLTFGSLIFVGMLVGLIVLFALNIKMPFIATMAYILVMLALLGSLVFVSAKVIFSKKYGKLNFINEGFLLQTIDINE